MYVFLDLIILRIHICNTESEEALLRFFFLGLISRYYRSDFGCFDLQILLVLEKIKLQVISYSFACNCLDFLDLIIGVFPFGKNCKMHFCVLEIYHDVLKSSSFWLG